MSVLRRATVMKSALNFMCRGASPYSSCGFRSTRILGGVSIPRPPPSRPHVFYRGFSAMPVASEANETPSKSGLKDLSHLSSKELLLLDGCDFEHWFIVVDEPQGEVPRDQIIDGYIKTLANVVGSEEEAKKKIYSVSTKHYYAFGCLISEETSKKLSSIPNVRWVLPDSYFNPQTKSYGGEPFIDGQAVPYDPKYHEDWVRNNARCNEKRSRPSDKQRTGDRPRNFDRQRDTRQNAYQRPPPNSTGQHPQGNTTQNFDRSRNFGPRREMGQNTYQRPPPNSTDQPPQGNDTQNFDRSRDFGPRRESGQNAYQRPPPYSTDQPPQGNTMQNFDRPRNFEPRREMGQNAYQRPPPNSSDQIPQGNTMQNFDRPRNFEPPREMGQNEYQRPPSNSTYQAPQGNNMQGAPDSQGQSN